MTMRKEGLPGKADLWYKTPHRRSWESCLLCSAFWKCPQASFSDCFSHLRQPCTQILHNRRVRLTRESGPSSLGTRGCRGRL